MSVVAVRTCEQNGQPGWQWRPAAGPAGPCHTYDPEDETAERYALRSAARDGNEAIAQEPPAAS